MGEEQEEYRWGDREEQTCDEAGGEGGVKQGEVVCVLREEKEDEDEEWKTAGEEELWAGEEQEEQGEEVGGEG